MLAVTVAIVLVCLDLARSAVVLPAFANLDYSRRFQSQEATDPPPKLGIKIVCISDTHGATHRVMHVAGC